ncbi:MAG: class I adenylate-forming enzyme family protein [Acidimicrobiia bacterium]
MSELVRSELLAEPGTVVAPSTVASVIRGAAATAPDVVALVEGVADVDARRRFTYAELLERSERVAVELARHLEPGERVALFAGTTPEAWMVVYGVALAGLVLVPVHPGLRRGELEHVLASSGAAAIVVGDGIGLHSVVDEARAGLHDLRVVFSINDLADPPPMPDPVPLPDVAPDDLAFIVYTSGTTGTPKGVELRHGGITNAGRFGSERFAMRRGDVYADPLPIYHVGGLVIGVSIAHQRATMVLFGSFDAATVLDLIESERATLLIAVPTVLYDIFEHPAFDPARLASLRSISTGGSIVPAELVRRVRSVLDATVTIVFGQTECSGYVSQTHLDDSPDDIAATVGRPLPGTDVRVADPETGVVVPVGEIGEIQVRGYNVMAGYRGDPEQTAEAFADGGWLRTGDLGTLDSRGYLRVVDRLRDVINSGATNVYPAEVERLLYGHADIGEVAVIGLPDPRWGERVVAVVRASNPQRTPDAGDLDRFAREHLASYKVPKEWVVLDELPHTPSGKVRKAELRTMLVDRDSSPIEETTQAATGAAKAPQ